MDESPGGVAGASSARAARANDLRVRAVPGFVEKLGTERPSVQADPGVGPRLCTALQPEIPADIALPAGFAETEPALAQARDWINTGLATLRESWTYWRTGCTSGDLANRVNTGLQSVLVAKTAFDTAREFLNLVPQ